MDNMMKHIVALLGLAFCFTAITFGDADAAKKASVSPIINETVPVPLERAFAQAQTAQSAQTVNSDPFNVNRTPQVAPAPVPQPTPVIVQSQPPAETKVSDWGSLGLSGIIAALLGKLAFFNKPSSTATAPGTVGHLSGLDPAIRATIDDAVLQLVQSGKPGEAIKIALSLIPGAGPIVTMLEPAFRAIAIKFLQDRIGTTPVATTDPATAPAVTNVLTILADLIAKHKQAAT